MPKPDAILFDLDNTYTVSLGPDNTGNRQLQVESGRVNLDLFGNTYQLSNGGALDLQVENGWLNSVSPIRSLQIGLKYNVRPSVFRGFLCHGPVICLKRDKYCVS